jgi:N-acetyltransferase 10
MGLLTAQELLSAHVNLHDMQRLELYSRNLVDHHLILDLLPKLATFLFERRLAGMRLSYLQAAILLATGLQRREVDAICDELNLPANQVLAFFNKTIRKITTHLRALVEAEEGRKLLLSKDSALRIEKKSQKMQPLRESLQESQRKDGQDASLKKAGLQNQHQQLMMSEEELAAHQISAEDQTLLTSIASGGKSNKAVPSVVSVLKRKATEDDGEADNVKQSHGATPAGGDSAQKKKKHKHNKKQHD